MGLFDFLKKKNSQNTVSNAGNPKADVRLNVSVAMDDGVVPAEKRIKSAIPSRNNGLYPHEILVLDYADSFYTQDNDYQQFWWHSYGVKSVDMVLLSLQERGLITIAPVTATLEKKTIPVLRELLTEYGLDTKGKKAILIQRIVDAIPENELAKHFPKRMYMRTEKGEAELKSEEYVSYIHRHSIENLDIWSLNKLVYGSKQRLPYRDVIWGFLNKKSKEHFSANDFGLYRNCRFTMSTFLKEEGNIKGELEMLAEVVFYDLSGAGNNYNPEYLYIIASHFFPYEESLATTAPGIINRIFTCQEKLSLTDEELREVMAKHMEKLSAPIQLFTIKECVDIVFFEHEGDKGALEKTYQLAEKRFRKKYPNLKKNPFA